MSEIDDDIHSVEISLLALRHAVYRDLHWMLPPASINQTMQFIANLALCRGAYKNHSNVTEREAATRKVVSRFRDLRVSPDIATATNYRKPTQSEIENELERKFGDALAEVPGFYLNDRWRLNLPEGCVFFPYRSALGFINGFLCQSLSYKDRYFLLSSAKYDGYRVVGMRPEDRIFYEAFKEPPGSPEPLPECPVDLPGFRWTGRRFVETTH